MSTADEDGPPALCNECSAKWHAYVRSRTPQSSSTTRPSVVAAAAMQEEGDSLVVQGQGSILVALHNATDSEPATQGASNREVDLDEMEFGSRMDQLRAALARVKAEPNLDPVNPSECMAAAMVWSRLEPAESPTELKAHRYAGEKSPSPRGPSRGRGGSASPSRPNKTLPVEMVADSMSRTVADRLQIMQWELERRDRNVRQREATLKTELRDLQKLRTQLAVKQATLETAFLELKKREHDMLRSEALLAEKRRALRHREEVDTMVANASARRAREMQEGGASSLNHRTPPQRHVNPNSLVSSPPPVRTSSTGRQRQADAEGLPVHSVEEAMEIFTATEQFIDAQRRELMRETEAAWGAIRLREAQLAERERKLHAVMKEQHAHFHVRPAAPSAPLQRHPGEEDNDEEPLQQFDDL